MSQKALYAYPSASGAPDLCAPIYDPIQSATVVTMVDSTIMRVFGLIEDACVFKLMSSAINQKRTWGIRPVSTTGNDDLIIKGVSKQDGVNIYDVAEDYLNNYGLFSQHRELKAMIVIGEAGGDYNDEVAVSSLVSRGVPSIQQDMVEFGTAMPTLHLAGVIHAAVKDVAEKFILPQEADLFTVPREEVVRLVHEKIDSLDPNASLAEIILAGVIETIYGSTVAMVTREYLALCARPDPETNRPMTRTMIVTSVLTSLFTRILSNINDTMAASSK